jgi:hypothetical protein
MTPGFYPVALGTFTQAISGVEPDSPFFVISSWCVVAMNDAFYGKENF